MQNNTNKNITSKTNENLINNPFHYGFVCVIGKANAGKSSLINALVREKVSIVSPKPQTTRENVMGIYNDNDSQIVFIDTPGVHKSTTRLGDIMNKNVREGAAEADIVLILVDGSKGISDDDIQFIKSFSSHPCTLLAVTKTDLTNFEKLYPHLSKLNSLENIKDIIPISSHKERNLDVLISSLKKYLVQGTPQDAPFDTDIYTNKSVKFIIAETIREKLLLTLDDEVPHGIIIVIHTYEQSKHLIKVGADIICSKQSHKSIIIGKKASTLKKIGQSARLALEKQLGYQIYLDLFVKVKENWQNSAHAILADIDY